MVSKLLIFRVINPYYSSKLLKMNVNAGYPDLAEPNSG